VKRRDWLRSRSGWDQKPRKNWRLSRSRIYCWPGIESSSPRNSTDRKFRQRVGRLTVLLPRQFAVVQMAKENPQLGLRSNRGCLGKSKTVDNILRGMASLLLRRENKLYRCHPPWLGKHHRLLRKPIDARPGDHPSSEACAYRRSHSAVFTYVTLLHCAPNLPQYQFGAARRGHFNISRLIQVSVFGIFCAWGVDVGSQAVVC